MDGVSDEAVLAMWEEGAAAHPLDRALRLIAWTGGDSADDPAAMVLAERDRRLFDLASRLFGPDIRVLATCDECGAETEVSFPAASALALERPSSVFEIVHEGRHYDCRLPDSRDLAHALRSTEPRIALLSSLVDADARPPELLDAVEAALEDRAGLEALSLAHTCSECGREATTAFDILDFVWRGIAAQAQRLMWDIHLLASAYGWSSREILALGPRRRAAHVAMVVS